MVAYGNLQSCPPDAEGRAVDAGCFLRYSDTPFFSDNQTTNISPFLGGGGSNKNKAIIGGVVGGGGGLLLIVGLILWYKLSRKAKKAPRGNILGASELQGPVTFSYKDLKWATKDFSDENKLGGGGFGDVYKGTLKNGNVVAVKKLAIGSSRAQSDFATEVKLISNVHHRNILRLLGCCSKGPELLLVYDCMANGSLDKFLYGERRGALNWKQRFDIIFGTARGLAYLHEQFHVCIIHRDIKPSNILLDDSLQPKIADFGLARLLPNDQSHLSTRFAGTLGYTAPEYAIHGQLSEKVDTYSFGVVVLEIISGRRCNEMTVEPLTEYLLEQAWKLYENDMHLKLVDETLDSNEYREEEMKKVIEIALMCTQSPVSSRPTMSEVVVLLVTNRSTDLAPATRPMFIDNDKRVRGDTSVSTGSSTSHATASFTEFTGR
ncbi:LRR receptor-like serine/threonine-protein kinase [Actinidia chinensis var. chinensis]|uniref:LRR receptor-like serine/threonine-protein kinase n=1 Tax=Actinidia chinensis var. chinensis TaxID=1590841 RepID=A0A2R6Q1L6_ACTCC|nr:LRR receptor-like serine/threonine-protein kinase [Actinidia chinensis var. chinensis]